MYSIVESIKTKDSFINNSLSSLKTKKSLQISPRIEKELVHLMISSRDNKGKMRKIPYGRSGPEDLLKIGKLLSKTERNVGRVSELEIELYRKAYLLNDLRKQLERYIKLNWRNKLEDLKKNERDEVINLVLFDIDSKINEIDHLHDVAYKATEVLKGTHFTLKELRAIAQQFTPDHLVEGYGNKNRKKKKKV